MEHNVYAITPVAQSNQSFVYYVAANGLFLRCNSLNTSPDNGHDISVQNWPVASPNSEASSGDDGVGAMISSSRTARHDHGHSNDKMAENDTDPRFPPGLQSKLSANRELSDISVHTKPPWIPVAATVQDVTLAHSPNQKRESAESWSVRCGKINWVWGRSHMSIFPKYASLQVLEEGPTTTLSQ